MFRQFSLTKPLRKTQDRPRTRLVLRDLEDRAAPAVFNLTAGGGESALRAAIQTSATNGDPTNTINLAAGDYNMTNTAAGAFTIDNETATPVMTLTIAGADQDTTIIQPDGSVSWKDRIFEIDGENVAVIFQDLTIEGGNVESDPGINPEIARGGGLFIDGADVTLDHVTLTGNKVVGADGLDGADGLAGTSGVIAQNGALRRAAASTWPLAI